MSGPRWHLGGDPRTPWIAAGVLLLWAARVLEYRPPDRVLLPLVHWELATTCGWRSLWNAPCPGCGLTRAFVLAADGRWGDAWRMHPPGVLLFVTLLCWIVSQAFGIVLRGTRRGRNSARQTEGNPRGASAEVRWWWWGLGGAWVLLTLGLWVTQLLR